MMMKIVEKSFIGMITCEVSVGFLTRKAARILDRVISYAFDSYNNLNDGFGAGQYYDSQNVCPDDFESLSFKRKSAKMHFVTLNENGEVCFYLSWHEFSSAPIARRGVLSKAEVYRQLEIIANHFYMSHPMKDNLEVHRLMNVIIRSAHSKKYGDLIGKPLDPFKCGEVRSVLMMMKDLKDMQKKCISNMSSGGADETLKYTRQYLDCVYEKHALWWKLYHILE